MLLPYHSILVLNINILLSIRGNQEQFHAYSSPFPHNVQHICVQVVTRPLSWLVFRSRFFRTIANTIKVCNCSSHDINIVTYLDRSWLKFKLSC